MKRFIYIFSFLFLFSCQSDNLDTNLPPSSEESSNSNKVSVETALQQLDLFLQEIDPQTRNGSTRQVKSIHAVNANELRATRSNASTTVGDIVYIANFEGNNGYAILGADTRITPVLAITEQGNLSSEQLIAASKGEYNNMENPPIFPEIGAYLDNQVNRIIRYDSIIGGGGGPSLNDIVILPGEVELVNKCGPYCAMKWDQGAPYNTYTPNNYPVGCVAVAIGQIVATNHYNKYYPTNLHPAPNETGGQPLYWDKIFDEIHNYKVTGNAFDQKPDNIDAIARLLYGIGRAIGMDYGADGSSASDDDGARFLRATTADYTNVLVYDLYEERLREMVINRKYPTYISGKKSTFGTGHAWVVDGAVIKRQHSSSYNKRTGVTLSSYTDLQLYHCNFGWGGLCDGYYHYEIIAHPYVVDYTEPNDIPNTSDRQYDKKKKIIFYTLIE